jgi:hypothetical protein
MANMRKYSEIIHNEYPLGNFELTGDLNKDTIRYCRQMGIPINDPALDISVRRTVTFRLSFGNTFIVHTLTDGVIEKVKHSRIENIPKETPKLMQNAFLIEARHDNTLFDDILSIGGFIANDEIYLTFVTADKDENHYAQTINKSFDGRKIEELNMTYKRDIGYSVPKYRYMKERKDIFSFILRFALMMEAERTPFVIDEKNIKERNGNNGNKSKQREKTGWIERRIYIDKTIKYKNRGDGSVVLNKEGKHLKDTSVHGFLRLQHFGKGLSESKWIYIDDYDSKRRVNPGDTRITVDIYKQ